MYSFRIQLKLKAVLFFSELEKCFISVSYEISFSRSIGGTTLPDFGGDTFVEAPSPSLTWTGGICVYFGIPGV